MTSETFNGTTFLWDNKAAHDTEIKLMVKLLDFYISELMIIFCISHIHREKLAPDVRML